MLAVTSWLFGYSAISQQAVIIDIGRMVGLKLGEGNFLNLKWVGCGAD
jgi:hypothetical protein